MSEGDVDGGRALRGGSAHDTGGSTEAWRGPEVEREGTEGQVTVRHGEGRAALPGEVISRVPGQPVWQAVGICRSLVVTVTLRSWASSGPGNLVGG